MHASLFETEIGNRKGLLTPHLINMVGGQLDYNVVTCIV